MASLAKWLSVRLRSKRLCVRIPLQSLKLQISLQISNKAFLDVQATTDYRFTLKRVCDMIRTQPPCHLRYKFEYVYLHTFHVKFLFKRHLSRGHRISCLAPHLEQTDSKPFSGLIEPRYMTTSRAIVHQSWRDAPLAFCNLAKSI